MTLFKSLFSYVLKLLIAIAPFLVVPHLLQDEKKHSWLNFLGKTKDDVRLATIAILSAIDLTLLSAYETWAHFFPQRQARQIADVYVESLFNEFEEEAKSAGMEIGTDIRVNVMFVKRSALTLFFCRFVWFANRGFDGSHKDNELFLLVRQGLCGRAFRESKTLSTDLRTAPAVGRWPCGDNFWLFGWQRKRTAHLTAILTIPIFAEFKKGPMTTHRAVGVINIDAVSEAGAERLLSNKIRLDKFFKESGKILALFGVR